MEFGPSSDSIFLNFMAQFTLALSPSHCSKAKELKKKIRSFVLGVINQSLHRRCVLGLHNHKQLQPSSPDTSQARAGGSNRESWCLVDTVSRYTAF